MSKKIITTLFLIIFLSSLSNTSLAVTKKAEIDIAKENTETKSSVISTSEKILSFIPDSVKNTTSKAVARTEIWRLQGEKWAGKNVKTTPKDTNFHKFLFYFYTVVQYIFASKIIFYIILIILLFYIINRLIHLIFSFFK